MEGGCRGLGGGCDCPALPSLCKRLGVKFERTAIEGVRCHVVASDAIAPQNRDRLLLHFHGGCYVLGPGEAGLPEAVLMAGLGGFQVISVDYRMPPEAYFPAAVGELGADAFRQRYERFSPLGIPEKLKANSR